MRNADTILAIHAERGSTTTDHDCNVHWRAGCDESRTSGSEGGGWKSAHEGNSPAAYPTTSRDRPRCISCGVDSGSATASRVPRSRRRWSSGERIPRRWTPSTRCCGKRGGRVEAGERTGFRGDFCASPGVEDAFVAFSYTCEYYKCKLRRPVLADNAGDSR
jgi:hypothetical protein